jgi:hypothetical protein
MKLGRATWRIFVENFRKIERLEIETMSENISKVNNVF